MWIMSASALLASVYSHITAHNLLSFVFSLMGGYNVRVGQQSFLSKSFSLHGPIIKRVVCMGHEKEKDREKRNQGIVASNGQRDRCHFAVASILDLISPYTHNVGKQKSESYQRFLSCPHIVEVTVICRCAPVATRNDRHSES